MDETHVAQRNGHVIGIFDIGNLVPTRRAVMVNGRELLGWVRGPGCKRSVDAEYRAALNRSNRADTQYAAGGTGPSPYAAMAELFPELSLLANQALQDSEAAYERFLELAPSIQRAATVPTAIDPIAWAEFLTEALLMVIPGLTMEEAELMDDQQTIAVLRHLEWFSSPEASQEVGDAADPPATSVVS